jgi:integrase
MATITKRGARWRVQVRCKGYKPVSKTFASQAEARRWAAQVQGRMAADEWAAASAAKRMTLGEGLRRYLEEVTPGKKGARQETIRILAWLREPMAERPLGSIRSQDVAEWRTARQRAGKAPTTIKNAVTILSQVYKIAASEWGMTGLTNPVAAVKMPRNRPHRERRLEGDEEARLLAACDSRIRPLVELAMETAMRQGELLRLERRHIRGNVAHLPDTKNGRARSVPLSSRAVAIVRAAPARLHGPLFDITQHAVQHSWRKAYRRAGIVDLHFHDLRHEATSRLFERGLDAFEIMSITGHSTTDMLKRYTHFRAKELAAKLG